jgi:hypothetical protein
LSAGSSGAGEADVAIQRGGAERRAHGTIAVVAAAVAVHGAGSVIRCAAWGGTDTGVAIHTGAFAGRHAPVSDAVGCSAVVIASARIAHLTETAVQRASACFTNVIHADPGRALERLAAMGSVRATGIARTGVAYETDAAVQ